MGGQLLLTGITLALIAGGVVGVALRRRRRRSRLHRSRAPRALTAGPSAVAGAVVPQGWRAHPIVQRWWLIQQIRQAQARRSLQRVSSDLRRLRTLICTDHHDSAVHQFAHRMAYDQVLVEACTMLGVPHGLGPELSGPERELERFRTEANLQAAGVVLMTRLRRVHE